MNKVIRRYKFVLGILIFFLFIMICINMVTKIKVDKFRLIQDNIVSSEIEFKQAKENEFLKLAPHLFYGK